MNVPSQIEKLLKQNNELHSVVLKSYSDFEPWLTSSGTPFFPEYTEHGTRHITDVLTTAISLATDRALSLITPADACILTLACLLHDSAMHLSEAGFNCLTQNTHWPKPLLPEDTPWPLLWAEFLSESSRFDERKLNSLFGDSQPVHRPPASVKDWTLRDRLLIGEFMRRHHARLAHEIAMFGVPGPTEDRLRITSLPADLLNLAGIVARSHGMLLRSCVALLDPDDPREYKGVHAIFLMTLLRVADYLQLQAERAPETLLKVKTLQSPFSQAEWRVHAAIADIRKTHNDLEAIFIEAAPKEVESYLKLKRLFKGLQEEMDACWAVLGEVYGRFPPWSELGLNLRRVRSNLDDKKQFASTVNYEPLDARFDTAGADLLKLLIRPLYGDRPEVGVRELLQNAVDACLELKDLEKSNATAHASSKSDNRQTDVEIHLFENAEGRFLRILDRGIGMLPATITDYFLRAGASFRRSDAWRQQHEADPGRSRVLRSGRFGVGALAAFLIGDEIEVITRHATSPPEQGITFKATLNTEHVQLNHCTAPQGTSITTTISDDRVWRLLTSQAVLIRDDGSYSYQSHDWDWYYLDEPKVIRQITAGGKTDVRKQRHHIPRLGAEILPPWRRIQADGLADVHWTYNAELPELLCNGIRVKDRGPYYDEYYGGYTKGLTDGMKLAKPAISVFDPDGNLPLNLQRTGLASPNLPFADGLISSQCMDYIAWCLACAPTERPNQPDETVRYENARFEHPLQSFAFCKEGTLLCDRYFLANFPFKSIIFSTHQASADLGLILREDEVWMPLAVDNYPSDTTKAWFRFIMSNWAWREGLKAFSGIPLMQSQIILSSKLYTAIKAPKQVAREVWAQIKVKAINDRWVLLGTSSEKSGRLDFETLVNGANQADLNGMCELSCPTGMGNKQIEDKDLSLLARTWKSMTNQIVIPYDIAERQERFAAVYSQLGPTISYHRAQAALKRRPLGARGDENTQLRLP